MKAWKKQLPLSLGEGQGECAENRVANFVRLSNLLLLLAYSIS
jgi:hypothetical protein